MEPFSIYAGDTLRVPIALNNDVAFTSLMMDVYLPDGLGLDRVEFSGRQAGTTTINLATQPDGAIRLIAYSVENKTFSGNNGNILDLIIWAKDATQAGRYPIHLRNVILTDANGKDYSCDSLSLSAMVNRFETTVQTPALSYSNQTITVGNVPEGATIRYTTDGSHPSRYSNISNGQIAVLENGIVKVMLSKDGMNSSDVASWQVNDASVIKPVITVTGDSLFTITSATPDAVIVYTMDGTTPTTESPVYRHPVKFDGNYVINAIAIKKGNSDSQMASDTIVSYVVEKPIIFLDKNNLCYISCVTPKSSIYYSWDGCTPTSSSTKYSGMFTIDGNGTLKAVGVRHRYYNSKPDSIVVASFVVADPVIELLPNNICQITTSTTGASIYYTLDGSLPTAKSTLYNGKFQLSGNGVIKAIALRNRYFDSQIKEMNITTFKAATPTIYYPESSLFSLSSSTSGATIYYTTDGSIPTITSEKYTGPVRITQECTLKALAVKDNYYNSEIATFQVTLSANRLQLDNFNIYVGDEQPVSLTLFNDSAFTSFMFDLYLPEGISLIKDSMYYAGRQSDHLVTAANQSDGAIRIMGYSMGNKTFSGTSGAFLHLGLKANDYLTPSVQLLKLKNILFTSEDMKDHSIPDYSAEVNISLYDSTATTPTFRYANDTVYITTKTEGATIRYTRNGTQPDRNSTIYTGPLLMTENCKIKALAIKEKYNISGTDSISIDNFIVDTLSLTSYDSNMPYEMSCVIHCATPDVSIHYTLDGSNPTAKSTLYTDTLRLTENCIIKAIGIRKNWYDSPLFEQAFKNFIVATPEITLYNKRLLISCTTNSATIHYTLDGTIPTVLSPIFSDTVYLTNNCEIKAIAVRQNYINSEMAYNIFGSYQTERPVIKLIENKNRCVMSCATEGSSIYYTLDGADPSANSSRYTDTFLIDHNCTIKAIAIRQLYKNSEISTQSVLCYGNTLTVDSISMSAGEMIPVDISLENDTAFTAFMADIKVPDGFTVIESSMSLSDRKSSSHSLTLSHLTDGSLRVIAYSASNEAFKDNKGKILSFNLFGNENLEAGDSILLLKNIVLTAISGNDCLHKDLPVNIAVEGYANTVDKPLVSYANDSLTIQCATPDAIIYYTIDGRDPVRTDAVYSGPVKVVYNGLYKVRAIKAGFNRSEVASFEINDRKASEPVIIYKSGKLWISSQTSGARIYYTTDGSEPTTASPVYTVPVTLSANCEIKAFATCSNMLDSKVSRYLVYKIGNYLEISDFTMSPTDKQTMPVKLENNKAFSAFVMDLYIPDGFHITGTDSLNLDISLAGRKSDSHTLSYHVLSDSSVRIMAYSSNNTSFTGLEGALVNISLETKDLPSGKYLFKMKNIYFTTADGTEEKFSDSEGYAFISTKVESPLIYAMDSLVTIECPTLGANTYYTLDGSDPAINGTLYSDPFILTGNCVIRAMAAKEYCTSSPVVFHTVNTFKAKAPLVSLDEYTVSMSCTTSGAIIHYTLDGSEPTENSASYTESFTVNPCKRWIIQAIAFKPQYNASDATAFNFTPLYSIGDANGDYSVNVTDVATVIYYIGGNDSIRFVFNAADISCDSLIDVTDVVGIVNSITGRNVSSSQISSRLRAATVSQVLPDFTIGAVQLNPGEEKRVPIYLSNLQNFTAFQFNLTAQNGIKIEKLELNPATSTASHNLMTFDTKENQLLALAYSMKNASFRSTSEPIAFITIKADPQIVSGGYSISASKIVLVTPNMGKWNIEEINAQMIVTAPPTQLQHTSSDQIESVTYYTTGGLASNKPQDGINIVRTIYKDGKIVVSKILIKR
ncbi:MAG: chitobiase/beta-hexosaminidase C-terminal domain-containing protein [Bacteroidota bacterium]|nr:chitobiase/beta-hexosaminidase C-terminal domain-containing protein [Bacteroidota bacterium]